MRARARIATLAGIMALGVTAAPGALMPASASAATTYGIVKQQNVPIRMSDGVELLGDIYRPADSSGNPAAGNFPVVLLVTPYRKSAPLTSTEATDPLIENGYIEAIVDARGTGSSNGAWSMWSPREQQDSSELVRWAAKLPGSDGKVGLLGISYSAENQFFPAEQIGRNSPLKAIFTIAGGTDPYSDLIYPGGIFNKQFMATWEAGLRADLDAVPSDNASSSPSWALAVEQQHAAQIQSFYAPFNSAALTGAPLRYRGTFYQQRDPTAQLPKIAQNGIPAFMMGGWFDLTQPGILDDLRILQNAYFHRPLDRPLSSGEPLTGRYQAVVGPWYHLELSGTDSGLFSAEQALELQWFNTWLKGIDSGLADTHTPLHAWQVGAGRWVDSADLPLAGTHLQRLYLGPGTSGTATGSLNDGTLTANAPAAPGTGGSALSTPAGAAAGADTLPYTPGADPCGLPTEQWAMGAGADGDPCVSDDRPAEAGALTYTSAPFPNGASLTGPMDLTLYASSTVPETEWHVTVEDVSSSGAARPLSSGDLLGSFRQVDLGRSEFLDGQLIAPFHPFTEVSDRPVPVGRVVRYDIGIWPTFAALAAGDRLRVTITSGASWGEVTQAEQQQLNGGVFTVERQRGAASALSVSLGPLSYPASKLPWPACSAHC